MAGKIFSNDQLPCMLNANDVKDYMRISRTQAYEQMHAEGFPLIRIGKRMLAPRDKFLQWVDNQPAKTRRQALRKGPAKHRKKCGFSSN